MRTCLTMFVVAAASTSACNSSSSTKPAGNAPGAGPNEAAFKDYMGRSKGTEAELRLRQIIKAASSAAAETSAYIEGQTALTPAKSCCEQNAEGRGKCAPERAAWNDPVWQKLDFFVDDPHYFQYQYTGTATSYKLIAVGDLDCDGTTITYTVDGNFDAGNPTFIMTKPNNAD
ncbi:MAG TPA: hypothetical protein PLF40_14165 [Kofleriaceae bacterium]|nr:hypothetical protein [Kofleriaceae bacterium]